MKRLKAWLLRWLGATPVDVMENVIIAHNGLAASVDKLARSIDEQTLGSQAAIAEVIQELNALRNSIPAAVAQPQSGVRVMRNFRDFRAAVERKPPQPQSIRIGAS